MTLTNTQTLTIILLVALGAIITRFLPFILFPENKKPPKVISYLGKALPAAMMGLLVVYCLRSVTFSNSPHGIPELISILVIIALHKWKSNVLLSIAGGTITYMFLLQVVFT